MLRVPNMRSYTQHGNIKHCIGSKELPHRDCVPHAWGGGRGRGRGGSPGGQGSELILGPGGTIMSRDQAQRQQKLIIPGGRPSPGPGAPPQLIIPDQESGGVAGIIDIGDSVTTPTPPSRYRPPPGFMNEKIYDDETVNMTADEMMNKLRSRSAKWYTLAKYIPALYKLSYTASLIDEIAGINPAEQSRWAVAGTVHESLMLSGLVSPEIMKAFDNDGDALLFPFRFLGTESRAAAAIYIVEKGMGPDECDILARAMKEWDRRTNERFGFSDLPGDCLAFKYLRDAVESKSRSELENKIKLALSVAVTEGARSRLQEELKQAEDNNVSTSDRPVFTAATLLSLRLDENEIGTRALPVLGILSKVSQSDVEESPTSDQEGPFGLFSLSGKSALACRWVSLPQWKALSMARRPIAINVPDCSKVSAICFGLQAKTDEERKRLQGPGLLVFDANMIKAEDAVAESLYLATSVSGGVEIVDGANLVSSKRHGIASLLFLCRPPIREALAGPAAETSQLLQL